MEKGKALMTTTEASYQNLDLYSSSIPNSSSNSASFHCPVLPLKRTKPPSLVSLCITVIGKHLEDLIPELGEIAISFPAHIKMAIAAIARRRKLLNDEVIIALADSTWEILDISCSDVSDFGLAKVAEMCSYLRAVDISRCSRITPNGVYQLVQNCHSLEILRCGGCLRSNHTARRCLSFFKPELKNVDGDSWEELDTAQITHGGQSLRWLVWPGIDPDSLETFSSECPRVKVNPQSSPFDFKGVSAPREALSDTVLDDHIVEDIDPSTWASSRPMTRVSPPDSSLSELSLAEKFRLAFVDRDTRLAPKRAKNARQHQRRAEREWMGSAEAKAISLASRAAKSLRGNGRN
ncbi:Protein AMN1-like protein [Bienertia sinuspersici]